MMSRELPSVLQIKHDNSLSMERALKQILEVLEVLDGDDLNIHTRDVVQASIDDVETMLAAINRD